MDADPPLPPALVWGGERPAAIAAAFLEAARPVARAIVSAHEAGVIAQDLVYLVWSYTHMLTNRLGIGPTPEAILRYFMHRRLEEAGARPAPAG